jgi:hypothetical protein
VELGQQVQEHIPVLARCISGIITSSTSFQIDCAEVLGLSPADDIEHFLSAKLLQIFTQQTRRDLPSAPGNIFYGDDRFKGRASLAGPTDVTEEEYLGEIISLVSPD